jgi:hypothetical protein
VPKASWPPDVHAAFVRRLLEIYGNDPDAAVHSATKWLLLRWGFGADIKHTDSELAKDQRIDPRFQWRISREGLTLITVDDPALDRVLEVSDTEITVAMFCSFRPDFPSHPKVSPNHSCPVNSISFHDAAGFCNRLSDLEGFAQEQSCYRPMKSKELAFEPVSKHRDLAGFRLPTSFEFEVICSARTKTRRYFGDSDALFDRYAWVLLTSNGRAHPVAEKLPNDYGLFDTLGNIQEWCEKTDFRSPAGIPWGDVRGGWFGWSPPSEVDRSTVVSNVPLDAPAHLSMGFRVVRTKQSP